MTVGLSSRTLSPYKAISTKSLSLTNAGNYETAVTFTVPAGQARLNASVSLVGVVFLSLIAPNGDLAEYNLPQGVGNYGNAQVANPAPGKWTALVATEGSGPAVPAQFQASTATWQRFGTVSPSSLKLAAGASGSFTLTVATPSTPGDQAGSIMVHNSANVPGFAAETSIPVTLRSLVPSLSTTFTGTLTGGNGRAPSTGQTAYYQVAVPSGTSALNVSVDTYNASNTLFAELVDPSGDAVSAAANGLLATSTGGNSVIQPEVGAQLHATDPSAGTWTLIIDFYNSVSGNRGRPAVHGHGQRHPGQGLRPRACPTARSLTAGATDDRLRAGDQQRHHARGLLRRSPAEQPGHAQPGRAVGRALTLPNVDGVVPAVPGSVAHDRDQGDGVVVGPAVLRHHLPLR